MTFDFELLSLNVRGMRDFKKSKKLFHWLSTHGASKGIAFLQETHSTIDVENDWKQRFNGEIVYSHGNSNSRGVGILFGSKLDYSVTNKWIDNEGRMIILQCTIQGSECLLINTYIPNTEKEQVCFLKFLLEKLYLIHDLQTDIPIIWGGDFNFVTNLELEAKGGNPQLKLGSIELMTAIKDELDLCDIWRIRNPDLKRFTWRGQGQGKASKKHETLHRRLDYFLISDQLQTSVTKTDIIVAPSTDHSALSIKFSPLPKAHQGPSFWKMNNSLLNDLDYVEKICNAIKECKSFLDKDKTLNPNTRWEWFKYQIRKESMAYSKLKAKRNRNFYADLENKIKNIECVDNWSDNEGLVKEHNEIKAQLEERSNHITEGLILKSKIQWAEHGEKSNKYFLNLESKRKSKTHVRTLLGDSNEEITNTKDILKKINNYFGNIYESKNNSSEDECLNFISQANTNKLNDEESESIEGKLTLQECFESLKSMGNNKSPGNDGLTKEFFLAFWKDLGIEMVNSLNYSFENGQLSTTQQQTIITLIEKPDKDVRLIENWRPISLLNVDVKVCSKALTNRIKGILPKLIHPNQAAFVEGRNINEPLRYLSDFMEYSVENALSSVLFAADFQKAFDSVEHNFIWATLTHFGFGNDFIRWLHLLLTGSKSCVQNNGSVTDFFEIKRGTKQGDPISPYIFILVIEILAQLIRDNPNIKGINLSNDTGNEVKVVLFADDATFTLQDVGSLNECLRVLNTFKQHSSLQLNLKKSEVGWVGPQKNKELLPDQIKKKVDFHQSGIRILGIHFSHNQEFFDNNNYKRVFEKFKAVLQIWKMRNLTLYGKAIIVKSLAMSQLLFVFGNLHCPVKYISDVKKELTNFIWNGRKPKVKYDTLIGDYTSGGIRLPDFESMIKANRIGWAKKIIGTSKDIYWKTILNKYFGIFDERLMWGENFDFIQWQNHTKGSKFYNEVTEAWSEVSKTTITNRDDVLRQNIWFNRHLVLNFPKNIEEMAGRGILLLSQIWKGTNPNWEEVKNDGLTEKDYLTWRGLLSAIPKNWREKLRVPETQSNDITLRNNKNIEISGKLCSLDKINSNIVYWKTVSKKQRPPTAQKNIQQKLGNPDIDWPATYAKIYRSTIDVRLRAFQYKIVNNFLFLNEKLYLFKKVDTPKCTFCLENDESLNHFFVECKVSRCFYFECKRWLKCAHITLPTLTLENVILGLECDSFQYFVFLLWKHTLYRVRNINAKPKLADFRSSISLYEKIEYSIAKKKSKLKSHLKKYETIKSIL